MNRGQHRQAAEVAEAGAGLVLFLYTQHLAGFQIDKVHLRARQTRNRLISVFVIVYFFGGPALHGSAGVWTAVEEWSHRAR